MDLAKAGFVLANNTRDKLEDHDLFLHFQRVLGSASGSRANRQFTVMTKSNFFLAGISQSYTFRAAFLEPPNILSSYCSLLQGRTRSEICGLSLTESRRSFFRLQEPGGFVVLFAFLERRP